MLVILLASLFDIVKKVPSPTKWERVRVRAWATPPL
jgi:hypothetical protein